MTSPAPDETRPFPIQATRTERPSTIPWWLAEEVYAGYVRWAGTDQTLERLAQRGGFSRTEVLVFLRARTRAEIRTMFAERHQ